MPILNSSQEKVYKWWEKHGWAYAHAIIKYEGREFAYPRSFFEPLSNKQIEQMLGSIRFIDKLLVTDEKVYTLIKRLPF